MGEVVPFNPLDKKNLGASVAEALLANEIHPLSNVPKFDGAGVYAIYYVGDFAPYTELASRNREGLFELPIYVGKAIPKGGRLGGDLEAKPGRVLYKRLAEHADSIHAVENLEIDDFYCRYLVVDDIWIPLGESLVITRFLPVWNTTIAGFGNHDPGSGRHKGKRPRWDVLHPGRHWALNLEDRDESADDIAREAEEYFRNLPGHLSEQFISPE